MILKLNHLKVKAAAATQGVIEAVYALVEQGLIDQGQFARGLAPRNAPGPSRPPLPVRPLVT